MDEQEMTWEEWAEELLTASGGEVDYCYMDEELAKINHPNLYQYYQMGYEPSDLVSERLMSYEGGDVVIWLDPDDSGDIDEEQLDSILANTEFYATFSEEISSLRVLNNLNIADLTTQSTLKRQIYIGAITCLETYLSDAFINTVLSNKEYLKSFFSSFKDFEERKIGMNELFTYFDKAEKMAKEEMLKVIYHQLPKISNMYKATFDLAFPDFSEISRYIAIRHDLVHRNGKTKKGEPISVNQTVVNEVICKIEAFVNEIDRNLGDKKVSEKDN